MPLSNCNTIVLLALGGEGVGAGSVCVWVGGGGYYYCYNYYILKEYIKSAKKWYHSIMVLWPYYVITYVTWGIFFGEISISRVNFSSRYGVSAYGRKNSDSG